MINLLMALLSILVLVPIFVFFIQVLAAYFVKTTFASEVNHKLKVAVLIPAHNESAGILDTLNSVYPQMTEQDQLLVVADNCTDNTADIVRAQGINVIERFDDAQRGKGFALDFGIQYLKKSECDVLVIVDADCIVETGAIHKLASYAYEKNQPIQGLYLMQKKGEAQLKSKIAEFAWCIKNYVRPFGFAKLGLPCQLMGAGMAFPWPLIESVDLANGNIVEDMKLGIDFAFAGKAPIFYVNAKVHSYFPETATIQKGQSKRWEHGHLSMMMTQMPKLLVKGLKERNFQTIAMAFDLSIPPLALLVVILFVITLLTLILVWFFSVGMLAFKINLFGFTLLGLAIMIAWNGFGKKIISFGSMLYVPVYILKKIPNYISFINKRQSAWNKTKREQDL
jgi:cellulose synthase/poly-beta-1,6-N-acetylglucosamine synthase-like glycosyltransferase